MTHLLKLMASLTVPTVAMAWLQGCAIGDKRIDANYDNLTDNRAQMHGLNQELEASAKEPPAWVTAYLDSWDCGDSFCTVGRAEISADDASPFTCLDVSRIKAKGNLVSTIQTDISNKIMLGAEGLKISQQQLKQILVEGFELRNLSNIQVGENYYQKLLKHSGESPQAFYQCFSVAKIAKANLQNLITREANKVLDSGTSQQFKMELDKEWNRFFKINAEARGQAAPRGDDAAKYAIAAELTNGDLGQVRINIVRVAKAFLSLPYQLGGDLGGGSIDCSNYVRTVFAAFSFRMPRTSPEQFTDGRGVAVADDLNPGDLVFFSGRLRASDQPSHVGIYVGEQRFISANGNANARKVQIDSLDSRYWQAKYLGARRFILKDNFPKSVLQPKVAFRTK